MNYKQGNITKEQWDEFVKLMMKEDVESSEFVLTYTVITNDSDDSKEMIWADDSELPIEILAMYCPNRQLVSIHESWVETYLPLFDGEGEEITRTILEEVM